MNSTDKQTSEKVTADKTAIDKTVADKDASAEKEHVSANAKNAERPSQPETDPRKGAGRAS